MVYDIATESIRPVAIGCLKIEVRPCVQVSLTTANMAPNGNMQDAQVFLQQSETVRLGQKNANESDDNHAFVRVKELKPFSSNTNDADGGPMEKDPVLLRIATQGTHIGQAYSGKVVER